MKINVKDLEGIANEGIVDLKKDFKIKLSNTQIPIGKGALTVNKENDKYSVNFIIYDNSGKVLHQKELISSDVDAMTKEEIIEKFDNDNNDYANDLNNPLKKIFMYLYIEYFDVKDFKTGNIVDYHYDDALLFAYIDEFSNDEARNIFKQLLNLMD